MNTSFLTFAQLNPGDIFIDPNGGTAWIKTNEHNPTFAVCLDDGELIEWPEDEYVILLKKNCT